MPITTTVLPPEVKFYFDANLLKNAVIPGDKLSHLWDIYIYIKNKLMKKCKYNAIWEAKCLALEKEFLEIYEREKKKKENESAEFQNKTQEPFYFIRGIGKSNEEILRRLKWKS